MFAIVLALSFVSHLAHFDPHDRTQGLYSAVRNGNAFRVRLLLAINPGLLNEEEPNTKRSLTPLQIAADRNRLAVMKVLIELGADLRKGADSWGTPLRIAACRGHTEAAELLLANGALLDLYSAVALDKRNEVEQIFQLAGLCGVQAWLANSRFMELDWRETPLLHVAAARGHLGMTALLLRYGADPDTKVIKRPFLISDVNVKGETPGLTPAGTWAPDLDVPVRPMRKP
jgi:ankyrin repeat protein